MGIASRRKHSAFHTSVSCMSRFHNKPGFHIHQPFHVYHMILKEVGTLFRETLCIDPLTQLSKELVGLGEHAFERSDDSKTNILPCGASIDAWRTYFWWEL